MDKTNVRETLELTTIWNQAEQIADTSEVWSPVEEDGIKFLQENREPGVYPKHLLIDNRVGYMIMPGIYYFGEPGEENHPVFRQRWKSWECWDSWESGELRLARKYAVLGIQMWSGGMVRTSEDFGMMYLAVDEENIEILKRMGRTMEYGSVKEYDAFTAFFADREFSVDGDKENSDRPSELPEEEPKPPVLESNAEELMPGLGIRRVYVGLKCVLCPRMKVKRYDYAYKTGNKLVLLGRGDDFGGDSFGKDRYEYDLRILEELTVRRKEMLNCGIVINRDYLLIDCREEKIKQILTPEAYKLFGECDINIV